MPERTAYQFRFMPKLIVPSSFGFNEDETKLASLVDDPDILRKCAGSPVVDQWGEIKPIKGHSMVHLIGLGATEYTGSNQNADGFKAAFCEESHPTFLHFGALYRNHKSKNYAQRSGDIIKTAWNPDMGRVELLVAANHDKCADFLGDIEAGKRRDVSMGFDCAREVCDICKHESRLKKDRCKHMKKSAAYPNFGPGRILPDGRKCFVDNPEGVWNDMSIVPIGADRIAQHLRKVAGTDDEIADGAELAELELGSPAYRIKKAIAEKLSRMEKIVPATVFREEEEVRKKFEPKTASILRDAVPSRMFAQLAESNVVLDSGSFFNLVFGEKVAELSEYLPSVSFHAGRMFSGFEKDPQRLDAVCESRIYDADKTAGALLSDRDSSVLRMDRGLDSGAVEWSLKQAALFGKKIDTQSILPANHPVVSSLLNEYAAYKLAALVAIDAAENPATLGIATMIG